MPSLYSEKQAAELTFKKKRVFNLKASIIWVLGVAAASLSVAASACAFPNECSEETTRRLSVASSAITLALTIIGALFFTTIHVLKLKIVEPDISSAQGSGKRINLSIPEGKVGDTVWTLRSEMDALV